MARAVAALLGCVAMAACSPTLREGYYVCALGRCPAGWSCHADGLCYSTPETDGGDADHVELDLSMPLDLGPDHADAADASTATDAGASNLYATCTSDADCTGLTCPEIDDAMGVPRQCSHACATDADCAPFPGSSVFCTPAGNCAASCHVGGCPMMMSSSCFRVHVGTSLAALCANGTRTIATPAYTAACSADDDCAFPFSCAHGSTGFCTLRCDPPTYDCPTGQTCVAIGAGSYCLLGCVSAPHCPSATRACQAVVSGGPKYCVTAGF